MSFLIIDTSTTFDETSFTRDYFTGVFSSHDIIIALEINWLYWVPHLNAKLLETKELEIFENQLHAVLILKQLSYEQGRS
jgi:hypothetical protein